jgi:hypothetical protein
MVLATGLELSGEELRAQALIYYCTQNGMHHSARALEMETRAYFSLEYFFEQILSGGLEDAARYFGAFVRDALFPGIGDVNAQPRVPAEILFEIRKCQALELAQQGRRDLAAQIITEHVMPLLEQFDLLFESDSLRVGIKLTTVITHSPETLLEMFGHQKERRKELKHLISSKLLFVPSIARAVQFSKNVEGLDIFDVLSHSALGASFASEKQLHVSLLLKFI